MYRFFEKFRYGNRETERFKKIFKSAKEIKIGNHYYIKNLSKIIKKGMYNGLQLFVLMTFCVLFIGLVLFYNVMEWLFSPNFRDNIELYLIISYWWFILPRSWLDNTQCLGTSSGNTVENRCGGMWSESRRRQGVRLLSWFCLAVLWAPLALIRLARLHPHAFQHRTGRQ